MGYRISCLLMLAVFAACSAERTHDSLDSAVKAAGSSAKDILIIVSKSDECHACSQLEQNVLTNAAWNPWRLYEVVKVDMTEALKKSDPERWQGGRQLQARYGARWFPVIVLTDSRGLPYHIGGYNEASAEEFFRTLEERTRERRPELAALLAKATNGAKARVALTRLREWGVDTAYHQLKALAMGGSKDPEYAVELVDYFTALGDLSRRDQWLRVLETGWPQVWRDTLVRQGVDEIEKTEFERFEWKQARVKLERLLERKPAGAAASRLHVALGEVAYQLRERTTCIGHFTRALETAPPGSQRDSIADRLRYLQSQQF